MSIQEAIASPSDDWLIWQLADSAFPVGSFAHSAGIEAAYQQGFIRNPLDVEAFLRTSTRQAAAALLPFLTAAYEATDDLAALDRHLDATLSNHVANRASRAQGQTLLATAEKVLAHPSITAYRRAALAENLPCHFPIALGLLAKAAAIPREKTIRLFFFMAMRTLLSAAVRLGAVGPIEAQQIQTHLSPELESFAIAGADIPPNNAAQIAPLLEILQASQDRLYSRLFQS